MFVSECNETVESDREQELGIIFVRSDETKQNLSHTCIGLISPGDVRTRNDLPGCSLSTSYILWSTRFNENLLSGRQ